MAVDYLSSEKFISCVLVWLQLSAGRDTNLHEYYYEPDKTKHRELLDDLMMYLLRRAGFVSPAQLENILDRMKTDYDRGKTERIPPNQFKEFCTMMRNENLEIEIPEKRPNPSYQEEEVTIKPEPVNPPPSNPGSQSPAYRHTKRHHPELDQNDLYEYEVHEKFQTELREKKLSALELDLKERELDLKERELKIHELEAQTTRKASLINQKLREAELRIAEANADIREHLYSKLKNNSISNLNLSL